MDKKIIWFLHHKSPLSLSHSLSLIVINDPLRNPALINSYQLVRPYGVNSYFKSAASRQHPLLCLVWNPDNPRPSITQVMRRSIQINLCITKWLLRAIARSLTLLSSNSFQGCLQSLTDFVDKYLFALGIEAVSMAGVQVCRCSFHSNPVSYRTHRRLRKRLKSVGISSRWLLV